VSAFHGVEIQSRSVGGVRWTTSAFPAGFSTPRHAHDEAYFCLVLAGSSRQRSGQDERFRVPGRAYFYPSGEVQSECFGRRGSRLFSVAIGAAVLERSGDASVMPRASFELAGPSALRLRRLAHEARGGDLLCVEDLALELVAALIRERCHSVRWAPVVREYLHAHYSEKLTLQEIARVADLHAVHLCRAFSQRFGLTLGQYLRALRVDHAARELVATDRPIADIAVAAGFASQPHMTREWRRHLGTTPAAYRRLQRGPC